MFFVNLVLVLAAAAYVVLRQRVTRKVGSVSYLPLGCIVAAVYLGGFDVPSGLSAAEVIVGVLTAAGFTGAVRGRAFRLQWTPDGRLVRTGSPTTSLLALGLLAVLAGMPIVAASRGVDLGSSLAVTALAIAVLTLAQRQMLWRRGRALRVGGPAVSAHRDRRAAQGVATAG